MLLSINVPLELWKISRVIPFSIFDRYSGPEVWRNRLEWNLFHSRFSIDPFGISIIRSRFCYNCTPLSPKNGCSSHQSFWHKRYNNIIVRSGSNMPIASGSELTFGIENFLNSRIDSEILTSVILEPEFNSNLIPRNRSCIRNLNISESTILSTNARIDFDPVLDFPIHICTNKI